MNTITGAYSTVKRLIEKEAGMGHNEQTPSQRARAVGAEFRKGWYCIEMCTNSAHSLSGSRAVARDTGQYPEFPWRTRP